MKYSSVILVSLFFLAVNPAEISQTNSTCLISRMGILQKRLHEWYDDECNRFRCEIVNGKEEINITSCQRPKFPENALYCKVHNEDNKEEEYPNCCARLRCLVLEKGSKYITELGQPEEIFDKIPVLDNQELSDTYEDFEYEAMSSRHRGKDQSRDTEGQDREDGLSPDVLGNRDYNVLFNDEQKDSPIQKLKAGPPQYYVYEPKSPAPKTLLEWMLWPLRGLFSSKIEILGVTRFSMNSSFVKNHYFWWFGKIHHIDV